MPPHVPALVAVEAQSVLDDVAQLMQDDVALELWCLTGANEDRVRGGRGEASCDPIVGACTEDPVLPNDLYVKFCGD